MFWFFSFDFELQLKEDIQVRSNEAQREARKKEKIEKELKQAKNDLETRTAELKTKSGNLQRAQEDITKLEQQLKEQRVSSWQDKLHMLIIIIIVIINTIIIINYLSLFLLTISKLLTVVFF